ncbi:hypothetical protein ENSA5_55810 [Enhygromyxa salina]|uniref:Polyketide cyclase / dehydrase and lipid transport n=1 Tax=Enhygromyxa salina TaxID=215803 RepID=A0A2S9XF40_9BACT|nr:hypothetical protein [Enhygromyxa salina]PRP91370.1 hypothetical protein ENSA5_55810 [Enhygromyxa salina]
MHPGLLGPPPTAALGPAKPAANTALATTRAQEPVRSSTRRSDFVRSVQRLVLPPGRDAAWVAREYMRWLPQALGPILRVETAGERSCIYAWPLAAPLLELTLAPARSSPDRQLLYVTGGSLADIEASARPRLEFRVVAGGETLLAAIHDFAPRLPWPIYILTQARAHLWVMRRFGRHLAQMAGLPAAA